MSDIVIQIKTILMSANPAEVEKVKKEIEAMIQPVKIPTQVDTAGMKQQMNEIGKLFTQQQIHAGAIADKYKEQYDAAGKVKGIITQTNDAQGRLVATTYKATENLNEFEKVGHSVSANWGALSKNAEAINTQMSKLGKMRHDLGAFMNEDQLNRLGQAEKVLQGMDVTSGQFGTTLNSVKSTMASVNAEATIAKNTVTDQAKSYDNLISSINAQAKAAQANYSAQEAQVRNMDLLQGKAFEEDAKRDKQINANLLSQKDLQEKINNLRLTHGKVMGRPELAETTKGMQELENRLTALDPKSKDFQQNLNNIKSELKPLENNITRVNQQLKQGSHFVQIFGQSIFEAGEHLPLCGEPVIAGCAI